MAVISASDKVRKAAEFITEQLAENPKKSLGALLDAAGMRFNLTPLDAEALQRIFAKEKGER